MKRSIDADTLRRMYLGFFEQRGHTVISGASLMPQNDPTVLFTTAGMHPLVPYLLGEPHPAGKRLCNVQKCIRTGDIDSVGDSSHLTFFEMLGNWSLGDYFKEDAIRWSYEFLTHGDCLGFDPETIYVTVFEGNQNAPPDTESVKIWRSLGIPESRILALPMKDNWWGPAGQTGPCGPDTEMFVDTGKPSCGPSCRPGCGCGKFFEIWNDVFMQYEKTADGGYRPLKQHNVDTGMGVERTVAMLRGYASVYDIEGFAPVMDALRTMTTSPSDMDPDRIVTAHRVIADHLRSAVFILGDEHGVKPGNLGQGYVLRRLIRRAVRYARGIGLPQGFGGRLAGTLIDLAAGAYPELQRHRETIIHDLDEEEEKFTRTLNRGMNELQKVIDNLKTHRQTRLSGRVAFKLYDTYGFPIEFTAEICREAGLTVDNAGFEKEFKRHQDVSRKGAEKSFKGGLADQSEQTTRLHTATHLLHQALRQVLGEHVQQKGSNITAERLRFDFSHPAKVTPEQQQAVEAIVNQQIARQLPVSMKVGTVEEAKREGALALFGSRYDEQVKIYAIGDYSTEVCGGPHVDNTAKLGRFRILKEEASSAGVRRIRAVVDPPV